MNEIRQWVSCIVLKSGKSFKENYDGFAAEGGNEVGNDSVTSPADRAVKF